MFEKLKRLERDAVEAGSKLTNHFEPIKKYFCGLDINHLKNGWVTIPCSVLDTLVKEQLGTVDIVQDIRLSCEDDMLALALQTKTIGGTHEVKTRFQFTDFTLAEHKQSVSIRARGDVQVEGKTVFERIVGSIAELLLKAVLNQEWLCSLLADKKDIPCAISWPDITYDFSDRQYIKLLREATLPVPFMRIPLLRVISISQARIINDAVQLKLSVSYDILGGEKK